MRIHTLVALFMLACAVVSAPAWGSDTEPQHDDHAASVTDSHATDAASHETAGGDHGDAAAHIKPHGVVPGGLDQALIPAFTALLSFGVAFLVLYLTVWPKITKGLDERAGKIETEIASAEAARKQAKDALDEYEQNLAQARAQAQQMLDETKAKQTELAAQLKAKADEELTAMREKAMADIDGAKKAAINEIYAESVTFASTMAGKILKREINESDHRSLVEDSLAQMGSTGA